MFFLHSILLKLMTVEVRMPRLELGTSSLSVTRSNHLSYTRTSTTIYLILKEPHLSYTRKVSKIVPE